MPFRETAWCQHGVPSIGLYFADKKPERTLIGFQVPPVFGSISGIDIPPGENDYKLTSKFTTPVDIELIGVGAHMHYIGHTAKAHATLPDGTVKSLFYIDDWDFNWQGRYTYDQPIRRAVQWEWWFHRGACRQWFLVQRDTRTNQVLDSVLPGAAIVGASESGASDE